MRRADGARRPFLPEEKRAQTLIHGMRIRRARKEDAEAIARVHVESWRSTYRGIIAADFLANLSLENHAERWREILRTQNQKDYTFVADNTDGQIAGFISGGPQRDLKIHYEAELYALYLLESAQRRGLGRRLVLAATSHLLRDGFKNTLVWVLENNPSRKFYEALGGQYVTEKAIMIGDQKLTEFAYGWLDLRRLLEA
jgi:ribosomal protein S18 acetylase RimI-like enzyme